MHEDVTEACQRGQGACKARRDHAQLTHAQDGIVVVDRLLSPFQGDDAKADVNLALRCNLEVALDDVSQVGILVKVSPGPASQRFQPGQAFAQFVQAPLDTGELWRHDLRLARCHRAAHAAQVADRHSDP